MGVERLPSVQVAVVRGWLFPLGGLLLCVGSLLGGQQKTVFSREVGPSKMSLKCDKLM